MASNTTELDTKTSKNEVKRLAKNSKLYKTILKAIADKKGENVLSIDLRKITQASADFFVICEVPTSVQIKAISDAIEKEVQQTCEESPYRHEGYQSLQWVIVDYVNIVIHIMLPDIRKYYNLEEMWADGIVEEVKQKL